MDKVGREREGRRKEGKRGREGERDRERRRKGSIMFMVGFVLKHFNGRGTIILMVQNSEINQFQVLMDII